MFILPIRMILAFSSFAGFGLPGSSPWVNISWELVEQVVHEKWAKKEANRITWSWSLMKANIGIQNRRCPNGPPGPEWKTS